MSRAASWRLEVESVVREYPSLKQKKEDAMRISITPNYSGMPGSGTARRTTEDVALNCSLQPLEERKLIAVEYALKAQESFDNSAAILKAIDLTFFRKERFNISRISSITGFNEKTIKTWITAFLKAVWTIYLTYNG